MRSFPQPELDCRRGGDADGPLRDCLELLGQLPATVLLCLLASHEPGHQHIARILVAGERIVVHELRFGVGLLELIDGLEECLHGVLEVVALVDHVGRREPLVVPRGLDFVLADFAGIVRIHRDDGAFRNAGITLLELGIGQVGAGRQRVRRRHRAVAGRER